jgi:hypothetical protein
VVNARARLAKWPGWGTSNARTDQYGAGVVPKECLPVVKALGKSSPTLEMKRVDVQVDLFMRDAIIRGSLAIDERRTLDIFNDRNDEILVVRDATRLDILGQPAPERIGHTRILKQRILLAMPLDAHVLLPAVLRGWWVNKQRCGVTLCVGPYRLRGVVHVFRQEVVTLETVGRANGDVRIFMPITESEVWIGGRPASRIAAETVFVAREHLEALSLIDEWADPPEIDVENAELDRALHSLRPL